VKERAPPSPDISRLREASEWVQRLQGSTDRSFTDEWLQWCQADRRNLSAFEQMQQLWDALGSVDRATERPVRPAWRHAVGWAALALVIAAAVAAAWYPWPVSSPQVLATHRGERRYATLADGSQLDLAPNSQVSVNFTREHREVWLQGGQVFFTVAQDSTRPFIVHAGGLTVTSLGTAFDIRGGPHDVTVTVSEGRVNVSLDWGSSAGQARSAPAPVRAAAGQRLTFFRLTDRLSLVSIDLRVAESWRQGVLQFVAEPLQEVVEEVDLYSARPIVLGDPELGKLQFTGTVSQAHLDDWLQALKALFPVQVIDRGADGILIRAATPRASS
jgi:transmembrane sensor